MKILDDLISTLDTKAPVRCVRQGVFHTGVWTRACGLAATLSRDALRQDAPRPQMKDAGGLADKTPLALVRLAHSDRILEAAVGMAALNSLLEVDETRCHELNARELICSEGTGRRVVVVGHFPFIDKLRRIAGTLWVIEKNPQPGDADEASAKALVPQADVVAITGTAFTNHTIENLLALCDPKAYVIVLGGTTPLSPVLFDYGVDAVSGTQVVDPERALRCIGEGANFRQIEGTRRLTMTRQTPANHKC